MIKRLVAYGCSWTEGEGCDKDIEKTLSSKELKDFRNKNSWVYLLSQKLLIKNTLNNGISASSNRKIFNDIIHDIESGKITSKDFVCIMFSSSLRDYVPFLPDGEWISWSVKHLIDSPDKFYKSYTGNSNKFNKFLSKYKEFFISNLFTQEYYNYVNQNYIIFLQKLLKHYKIKYIMMESFESMVQEPINNDLRSMIDTSNIFGNLNITFKDFLISKQDENLWEERINYETVPKQHPSKIGYELIANTLYKFIKKNDFL